MDDTPDTINYPDIVAELKELNAMLAIARPSPLRTMMLVRKRSLEEILYGVPFNTGEREW